MSNSTGPVQVCIGRYSPATVLLDRHALHPESLDFWQCFACDQSPCLHGVFRHSGNGGRGLSIPVARAAQDVQTVIVHERLGGPTHRARSRPLYSV